MNRASRWLVGSDEDAQRLRDTNKALTRARVVATLSIIAVIPLFVHQFGWWVAAFGAAYIAYGRLVDYKYRVSPAAEVWMFSLTLVTQAMFGAVICLTGGPTSPTMALVPARYSTHGIATAAAFTFVVLAIGALSSGLAAFLHDPELPLITLSTAIGCIAFGIAMHHGELIQRNAAISDPLTGLLNRTRLAERFERVRAAAAAAR